MYTYPLWRHRVDNEGPIYNIALLFVYFYITFVSWDSYEEYINKKKVILILHLITSINLTWKEMYRCPVTFVIKLYNVNILYAQSQT